MLALNICIAVASGGKVLGKNVEKGSVIYLALEDTPRRLQKRIKTMSPEIKDWPETDNLILATHWPIIDRGGLDLLEKEIVKHEDLRFIAVDTMERFAPGSGKDGSYSYSKDYQRVMRIKDLADKHAISILLIHHSRKAKADDIFDEVSGTLGLTGAADGILVLKKKGSQTELHITGRDIENAEYALEFSPDLLTWHLVGDLQGVKSSRVKQAIYDTLKQEAPRVLSPKELKEITAIDINYIYKALSKLVEEGDITSTERGKYQYIGKEG